MSVAGWDRVTPVFCHARWRRSRGGTGGVRAYRARVTDREPTFAHEEDRMRDRETGSAWDLDRGRAGPEPLVQPD
jgi:hypothetical protein